MSRLTRDGTAEPVSRDQILRHARGQGIFIFPVQLTTSRIGNLTRLIHTLLYVMTIHTYISSRGVRGNGGREGAVELEEGTQYICKLGLLTPKVVGVALVEVFAVILPVEATTPLVDAPRDIGSEHGVCNA